MRCFKRTERLTHLGEVKADRPIYCYTAPLFCTSEAMPSAGEPVRGSRPERRFVSWISPTSPPIGSWISSTTLRLTRRFSRGGDIARAR